MGNQDKNLEAGTEVEAMEECWLLACSHSILRLLFYPSQGHLPRGDVINGWSRVGRSRVGRGRAGWDGRGGAEEGWGRINQARK